MRRATPDLPLRRAACGCAQLPDLGAAGQAAAQSAALIRSFNPARDRRAERRRHRSRDFEPACVRDGSQVGALRHAPRPSAAVLDPVTLARLNARSRA